MSRIKEIRDIASMISSERFSTYLSKVSHISGAHYPLNSSEILDMLKTYLIAKVSKNFSFYVEQVLKITRVVLFPETVTAFVAASLVISLPLCKGILKKDTMSRSEIIRYKHILHLTNSTISQSVDGLLKSLRSISVPLLVCQEDMKIVSKKEIWFRGVANKSLMAYEEYEGFSLSVLLRSNTMPVHAKRVLVKPVDRYSPMISGLRLIHIQTGSHYKLKCLLKHLPRRPHYVICGGDYSGGFTSLMLRRYPEAFVAFNSLLDLSKFPGGGMHPAPPSAVSRLPDEMRNRCLNLNSAWEEPSDLSDQSTWDSLLAHFPNSSVDTIVIDAEVTQISVCNKIALLIDRNLSKCSPNICVIFKCYYSLLYDSDYRVMSTMASCFERLECVTTEYTGTFSSEYYLICSQVRRTSQSRYVDESSLIELSKIIPALRSYESELERASRLSSTNTCAGLMTNFWVNGDVLLLGLLNGMGIAPTVGQRIELAVKKSSNFSSFFGGILFSLAYLMKELNVKVETTIQVGESTPVPSADWCESYGCMISGFLNLIALYTRNTDLFATVTETTNHILFYTKDADNNFKWSFEYNEGPSIRCRIGRKKHLMATWIRIFECWRHESNFPVTSIDFQIMDKHFSHELLRVQYRMFNKRFLMTSTGFFDLMEVIMGGHREALLTHNCQGCPSGIKSHADEQRYYSEEANEIING